MPDVANLVKSNTKKLFNKQHIEFRRRENANMNA